MRQAPSNAAPANGANPSSFSVFRVPGSRYAPSNTSSTGSGGPTGVPLTVGPSLNEYPGTGGPRNSYTSTIPASPPYRESMPDMGLEDYESLDNGGIGWMRTGRVVRVKETGQSYRFPLDDEHLPQIELTRQDIVSLRESMEMAIERAVKNGGVSWMENPTMAPANAKYSWKVHLEKKNCIMYRRKNDSPLNRNFLVRCKLECSMDDVMYGVMSDTTEDERTYLAHVHRDDFLDGAVLQLLARPNVDDPYQLFAIKWAAFQSPMDSMFAIRDMFFVEYSRTVIDPKGQKIVARVFQSINPKEYNAVERDFGFVRNDVSWVQLFRVLPGSNDTKVDVSLSGSVSFPTNANTPSWMANRFLNSMYSIITGMATAGDAKFIVNNQLVTEKPWVPNHERSACSVCLKSFSLLRHRHHCRICAEIMCTSCTLELALRTSMLPPSLRPEGGLISTEKFCFTCVEHARRDRSLSIAHELALASQAEQQALQQQAYDDANANAYEKENQLYANDQYYDHQAAQEYQARMLMHQQHQQQQQAAMARAGVRPPQGDLIPLNATGAIPTHAQPLRVRTNTAGPERLRQDAYLVDHRQLKTTNSLPTVLDTTNSGQPRLSEDVVTVTAIPSSFAKMEESIAAQQVLLRNMLKEGQKIMQQQQQQQQYYPPPPPPVRAPQYPAIQNGPQIDVITDDLDALHMAP